MKKYSDSWARQEALNFLCQAVWRQTTKIEGLYYEPDKKTVRIRNRTTEDIQIDVIDTDVISMLAAVIAQIQKEFGGAA